MNDINFNQLKNDFDTEGISREISSFSRQISESFSITEDCYIQNEDNFKNISKEISSVLICGMGGSAIGGDIARAALFEYTKVPIIVNRSASIPNWANEQTLVLISSYSGNTYETISAYNQARLKTNKLIVISSDSGLLSKYCIECNHIRLDIPLGFQPRCALGYISSIILLLFTRLNLINENHTNLIIKNLMETSSKLEEFRKKDFFYSEEIKKPYNMAISDACYMYSLKDKTPVIYGDEVFSSIIALRFRNQLQENSKVIAFSNSYPEINHNEIEGWNTNSNNYVMWLQLGDTDKSMLPAYKLLNKLKIEQKVFNLNKLCYFESIKNREEKESITQFKSSIIEVLYISIHYFDWVSYYLALLNKENPSSIDNIKYVKKEIS